MVFLHRSIACRVRTSLGVLLQISLVSRILHALGFCSAFRFLSSLLLDVLTGSSLMPWHLMCKASPSAATNARHDRLSVSCFVDLSHTTSRSQATAKVLVVRHCFLEHELVISFEYRLSGEILYVLKSEARSALRAVHCLPEFRLRLRA